MDFFFYGKKKKHRNKQDKSEFNRLLFKNVRKILNSGAF